MCAHGESGLEGDAASGSGMAAHAGGCCESSWRGVVVVGGHGEGPCLGKRRVGAGELHRGLWLGKRLENGCGRLGDQRPRGVGPLAVARVKGRAATAAQVGEEAATLARREAVVLVRPAAPSVAPTTSLKPTGARALGMWLSFVVEGG